MNISERIMEGVKALPESKQVEVFDFVEYLQQKTEKEESTLWANLSVASAMRGMETEEILYTNNDIKEIY